MISQNFKSYLNPETARDFPKQRSCKSSKSEETFGHPIVSYTLRNENKKMSYLVLNPSNYLYLTDGYYYRFFTRVFQIVYPDLFIEKLIAVDFPER